MANITRTFFSTIANVKIFDNDADEIVNETFTFPGKVAINDIKKTIEKSPVYSAFTVLKVVSVNYDEKLYSMTENDFMRLGKPYDERNKETRGTVSKEIIGTCADCVIVYNDDFTMNNVAISLPRKMTPVEAKKYINKNPNNVFTVVKVVNIRDIKQLYCVPVSVFMENAEILPPRAANTEK